MRDRLSCAADDMRPHRLDLWPLGRNGNRTGTDAGSNRFHDIYPSWCSGFPYEKHPRHNIPRVSDCVLLTVPAEYQLHGRTKLQEKRRDTNASLDKYISADHSANPVRSFWLESYHSATITTAIWLRWRYLLCLRLFWRLSMTYPSEKLPTDYACCVSVDAQKILQKLAWDICTGYVPLWHGLSTVDLVIRAGIVILLLMISSAIAQEIKKAVRCKAEDCIEQ